MEDRAHCLPDKNSEKYEDVSTRLRSNVIERKQLSNHVEEPVVIGGMVLDINAIPSVAAKSRTTTPGKVLYASGGVGRNVAECMSKLGAKPFMISAVGVDIAGNLLLEYWKSADLSIEGIQRHKDIETAVVCNIFDDKGELATAVACVESIEKFLTPGWIDKFESKIRLAPIMIIDANLSLPSLDRACQLAEKCNTPVWFEPVSVVKSKRVASVAKYVTFASPNEDELVAMANVLSGSDVFSTIKSEDTGKLAIESLFCLLRPAILVLLNRGIKVVVTTLGSRGVFLCFKKEFGFSRLRFAKDNSSGRQLYETVNSCCPPKPYINVQKSKQDFFALHLPALSGTVVRLTGAGDCLVGGTVSSLCAGLDIIQSVAVGIAAAKASIESESTVPTDYCLSKLADDARIVYADARFVLSPSKL